MADRNPTGLRDETGNQYCKNCEQDVYAKTPFSFGALIAFAIGMTIIAMLINSWINPGNTGPGLFFGFPSGLIAYVLYWFFVKQPVCPMCNAKNFDYSPVR